MKRLNLGIAVAAAMLATGCAPHTKRSTYGDIQREALAGLDEAAPSTLPLTSGAEPATDGSPAQREISHGTGRFIQPQPLKEPRPAAVG
jgi:general secretion pathway protein D